jgi:hypothetical protein
MGVGGGWGYGAYTWNFKKINLKSRTVQIFKVIFKVIPL